MTESNNNLKDFEYLESIGYLEMLSPMDRYHLFVSACGYDSADIAMCIYRIGVEQDALKEFMINYLSEIGGSTEFLVFRWIWNKNQIKFNTEELNQIGINILNSGNIDFVEWFYSFELIDLNNVEFKKLVGEVLSKADKYEDYQIAKHICSLYIKQ